MARLTMITRHGETKSNVTAYTLINEKYQTVVMPTADLVRAISTGKVTVTNLAVSPKGLVSTNGALDKYTFINAQTNMVEGIARAVILDRVEQDGKLLGYTVFTQNGQIRKLGVTDAAALASKGLIANGKIRHTAEGDTVSAIGGTYPLTVIALEKAPKGKVNIDIMFCCANINDKSSIKYAGAIISGDSAVTMSKINDKLAENNAKVRASVAKVSGKKETESIALKRYGACNIYGVFSLDELAKLAEKATAVKCNGNIILLSVIDYAEDGAESVGAVNGTDITIKSAETEAGKKMLKVIGADANKTFGKYITK